MRYLLTGGGTSGHVNPAIAIADLIRELDSDAEILFVGTKRGLESRLVPQAGYKIEMIDVRGLSRSLSPGNLVAAFKAAGAYLKTRRMIKRFKPDVAVGTGGYVSGPVILAAAKMGVPTAIHESNAYPGVTTRMLAKHVDALMLGLPLARELACKGEMTVTGNPVAAEISNGKWKMENGKSKKKPLVVSVGGSRGARTLNEAMIEVLARSGATGAYNHIHGTGKVDYEYVCAELDQRGVKYDGSNGIAVLEYIEDRVSVYGAADLMICRAGSMTLAEVCCIGVPSILIPSPNVTENHQYHNAKALEDAGAALILEDDQASGEQLWAMMEGLLGDPEKMREMGEKASGMAKPKALEKVVGIVMELAGDSALLS